MNSAKVDFEDEQAEIVNIVKSKERRIEGFGDEARWSKFNEDLACRVVKQFLKRHLPQHVRLVGPNVYIEGLPTELDLLLVTENAIPAAFTNAYRDNEVRFMIDVKSHRSMNREDSSELSSEFEALQEHCKEMTYAFLTILETSNLAGEGVSNRIAALNQILAPRGKAFCLAESEPQEVIPGQWWQFVHHALAIVST